MTQKEKDLLLKDLCGRLPYGVMCRYQHIQYIENGKLIDINMFGRVNIDGHIKDVCDIKPYLFPLSSMTEEQREEFVKFADYEPRLEDCGRHQELYYYDLVGHENNLYPNSDAIDWLNKNHFDYRGLIEKGLANDATNLNIY